MFRIKPLFLLVIFSTSVFGIQEDVFKTFFPFGNTFDGLDTQLNVNSETILKFYDAIPIEYLQDALEFTELESKLAKTIAERADPELDPELVEALTLILTSFITPVFNVSDECRSASMFYMQNLNQSWGISMIDSIGKIPSGIYSYTMDVCELLSLFGQNVCENNPSEFLLRKIVIPNGNTLAIGAVEECLDAVTGNPDVPFDSKYVLLKLVPPPKANESSLFEKTLPNLPEVLANSTKSVAQIFVQLVPVSFGRCVPSVCTDQDVSINYKALFQLLGIETSILTSATKESVENLTLPPKTKAFIAILSILAFMLLLGTLVDIYEDIDPHKTLLPKKFDQPDSTLTKILKCFSVYSNGKKILNTDAKNDGGGLYLGCLSGIRFISMSWVVLGHTFLMVISSPLRNPNFSSDFITGSTGAGSETVLNALPSVDTFFFLSGTLVAYVSFLQLEKKRFNLAVFYIHRYIRLTIPYAFLIGFVATIVPFLGWGLGWQGVIKSAGFCEKNGWLNILYVNNFFRQEEMCMGVTWYLANDMQFYFLSPLFIIPLWYNMWAGLAWLLTVFVGMTFVIGYFVIKYSIPPSEIYINALLTMGDFNVSSEYYIRPYIRFQPYLMGILFGYLLFKLQGRKVKIPHALNVVMWQVAVAIGLAVVYGLAPTRAETTLYVGGYTILETVFYNCFYKVAWSLALAWVIFSCSNGYGGIIDSFLSWGLFQPLGRLTYMAYLIHMELLSVMVLSLTYSVELSNIYITEQFIGALVLTLGLSFAASLAFEAPFLGLEKIVMQKLLSSPKKDTQKETIPVNSQSEKVSAVSPDIPAVVTLPTEPIVELSPDASEQTIKEDEDYPGKNSEANEPETSNTNDALGVENPVENEDAIEQVEESAEVNEETAANHVEE